MTLRSSSDIKIVAKDAPRRCEKAAYDLIDAIPTMAWSSLPDRSNIYVNKPFVESHGGRLWASANDGRGATFHFTLPSLPERPNDLGKGIAGETETTETDGT